MAAPTAVSFRSIFHGRRGTLALGLLLLEFSTALQSFFTSTVLPIASQQLNGARFYGIALTAGVVASFIALPFAAPLTSRIGAKRSLRWASLLCVIGILVSATATVMPTYAAGRFIQGLASSVLAVYGLGAVVSDFPEDMRSRLIALISSMWIIPGLVGPIIAATLTQYLGWRWAIASLVLPLAAGRLMTVARLTGAGENIRKRQRMPLPAATALALGLIMLLGGGTSDSAVVITISVVGLVLTLAAASRLLPKGSLLARRGRPSTIAAFGLLNFSFFGADSLITLYTVNVLGRPIEVAAPALTAGTVCWALAALAQPRMSEYFGERPAVLFGAFFLVAGNVALLALTVTPHSSVIAVLWVGWMLGGIGMGLCYPLLSTAILANSQSGELPAEQLASAVVLSESLGGGLGLAIGGTIVAALHVATSNYRTGIIVSYSIFIAAALLMTNASGISGLGPDEWFSIQLR